jgi:uncharacterized cupredoxin-like copper-binding protein
MATTEDRSTRAISVEDELHQLEVEENELEGRASTIELHTILIALLAGVALIFSIAALAVALIRTGGSGNTTAGNTPSGAVNAATGGAGMGAGMMSAKTTNAAPVVNGAHVIKVQLGEMYARPSVTSVPAGKVTFRATNMGMLTHELMVERMPMKFEGAGKPVESAAQGMIQDMEHGQSGHMTMTLKPGKYMLFCNVPGHYAAGQHTVLTVTRS